MRCPVCKTECGNKRICPICGFPQPLEFINIVDVEEWKKNVLAPYIKKWSETKTDYFKITGNVLIGLNHDRIENVIVPDGVRKIEPHAFSFHKTIKTVIFPESLIEIGASAFMYCERLQSISFPDSLSMIREEAFLGCKQLSTISIPDSVQIIDKRAFKDCRKLKSVVLSNSLQEIGDEAFFGCRQLYGVVIPKSVKAIGTNAFALENSYERKEIKLFFESDALKNKWNARNVLVFWSDMWEYDKNHIPNSPFTIIGNSLAKYRGDKTFLVIPSSVRYISSSAFMNNRRLKSIVIPKSIKSIDPYSFECCLKLETIFCEVTHGKTDASTFKPGAWSSSWNKGCNARVFWGEEWEYDHDGKPHLISQE